MKYIFLGIITLGIYPIVFFCGISEDINTIAQRYDRKNTMFYFLVAFLSPFTLGIALLVWYHRISNRIGNEARRRGIATDFSAASFWLWNVLGAFIIVGPFIYLHLLAKTSNAIATDYNARGF